MTAHMRLMIAIKVMSSDSGAAFEQNSSRMNRFVSKEAKQTKETAKMFQAMIRKLERKMLAGKNRIAPDSI